MALNTEERKKALSDLIANQKPISTRKISFAGENKDRDVYRIPIEYLVLNVANGRINSDVDSWEVQNGNIDIEDLKNKSEKYNCSEKYRVQLHAKMVFYQF